MILDHILLGAPDLDEASSAVAALTGIAPAGGGSHPGFGTRNQLLSLGEALFFEIIAPDPAQTDSGHRAEGLARMTQPAMMTFCMRSTDLAQTVARASAAGIAVKDPVAMSRTRADGVTLNWEILYFDAPEWGESLPFVIDWKDSPHPAASCPGGCSLGQFSALHPRSDALRTLYTALGIEVPVVAALTPGFLLQLETPRGALVLT